MAKVDYYFTIQDDVSYYRRFNRYEKVWTTISVLSLFCGGAGLLILFLAFLFQRTVTISPIGNSKMKFRIPRKIWADYRSGHDISFWEQYGKHHVAPKDNDEVNVKRMYGEQPVDVTSEIAKYKKLLDDGAITQEEFDEKKAKLLH